MPPLTTGTYSSNETIVYNYLTQVLEYNLAITCVILANMFKESGFDPEAGKGKVDNNGFRSYGLVQWNDKYENAIRMESWCKNHGYDSKLVMSQLKYFTFQIYQGDEKGTGRLLDNYNKGSYNTRAGAIEIAGKFFSTFERGASTYKPEREEWGGKFWDAYVGSSGSTEITYNTDSGTLGDRDLQETLDYSSLNFYDPYSNTVAANLSKVKEKNYDYGYLIDLTHGGQFKFYIPEFTEQAGVNWSNIDIPGRSVDLMSYSSTASRSIPITLELYAGAGLYAKKNPVTNLHKDVDFVKSLEYPDYSNPISRPPSTVQLILGPKINMVGVIKDVVAEHRKPLDSKRRSMYIHLTFTFVQIAVNPPDYSDIRAGHYNLLTPNSTDIN